MTVTLEEVHGFLSTLEVNGEAGAKMPILSTDLAAIAYLRVLVDEKESARKRIAALRDRVAESDNPCWCEDYWTEGHSPRCPWMREITRLQDAARGLHDFPMTTSPAWEPEDDE